MKPLVAWLGGVVLLAATLALFWAPPLALAAVAWLAFAALRRHRLGMFIFVVLTLAIDAFLLAWTAPGTGAAWTLGPMRLGLDGALAGVLGGLRLTAIVLLNVAFFSRVGVAAWIDGLRLPRRTTVFLGALLIASQDLAGDVRRLVDARKMTGTWPPGRWRQMTAVAALVAPIMVSGVDRARRRRDALQMAGMKPGRLFVPLVAVTSIALAGRLALIAIPNVSLTYVVVFAGGVAFGPLVGLLAGAISMGLSDVVLSGFTPSAWVNVPAMAAVGLLGGLLAGANFAAPSNKLGLAMLGVLATFSFSILADSAEWLIIPEFRGQVGFLTARIASGLAFNVVPAITNAVLFVAVVPAVQRAFRPTIR